MSLITCDHDVIDWEAGVDNEVRGQECRSCFRLLTWNFFDRNSSYKTGREPQCSWCKAQPRLSLVEHTSRLREMNYNSEGTRRQRHVDQTEMREFFKGRSMDCSLFLQKLLHIYPSLFVKPGRIIGDLALYATGLARPEWEGNTYKYLGFVTLGQMPEFSEYEFDETRDVMIRETSKGWRTMLLRFVKTRILTEKQILAEFGPPSGGESSLWYKKLNKYRHEKVV